MHNFKPGDLALIVHSEIMQQNIGVCCELVQKVMRGEKYIAPNGDTCRAGRRISSHVWLITGESVVGLKWTDGLIKETPGYALIREEWLIPLRGDHQPEQQKSKEVEHG